MPRPRSEARDKAYRMWRKSGGKIKLVEIAEKLGVAAAYVRKWKAADKWHLPGEKYANQKEKRTNSTGTESKNNLVPKCTNSESLKTQTAVNKGGAPKRNKNAVKTHEYETIWLDVIDDDEKGLFDKINPDVLAGLEENRKLLIIRKRRMIMQLREYKEEREMLETTKIKKRKSSPVIALVKDEKTGEMREVMTEQFALETDTLIERKRRLDDYIAATENALTRIQAEENATAAKIENIINARKTLGLKERLIKSKEEGWG